MAWRWREDSQGAWHHVMNRGLARRSVFEDRECVRYFLSCLARVVRKGLLEVHAYCVMTTHFHLLVRSPTGELSRGMQLVQNRYVRWFNRRARRDGPLFRGRFLSRHVDSLEYRRTLVRYIDHNPVAAGMVLCAELYPHGSARRYREARGPLWLRRSWVEEDARARAGASRFSYELYQLAFGAPLGEGTKELVEARLLSNARGPDPLDDLIHSAPESVGRWMQRKAELADGTRPGIPCASPTAVLRSWEQRVRAHPEWRLPRGGKPVEVWPVLLVGLLRDLAGSSWTEIRQRTNASPSGIQRRYQAHQAWMGMDAAYLEMVGEVGVECVRG
jgi:REP element-mobilizing transposase RayT